jgi:Ca2+-binding EF-hand superfamily protein
MGGFPLGPLRRSSGIDVCRGRVPDPRTGRNAGLHRPGGNLPPGKNLPGGFFPSSRNGPPFQRFSDGTSLATKTSRWRHQGRKTDSAEGLPMSSLGGVSIASTQYLASLKQHLATGGGSGQSAPGVNTLDAFASAGKNVDQSKHDHAGGQCSASALSALISLQEYSGSACSAENGGSEAATSLIDKIFAKLDSNGDGKITKVELEAAFSTTKQQDVNTGTLFGKLDTNGDGSISEDEIKEAFGSALSLTARLFARLDADGDGKISKAEFDAAFTGNGRDSHQVDDMFAKLDADGDGTISKAELSAASRHDHDRGAFATSSKFDGAMMELKELAATTETTTAADGSTTTVLTYADGTKVTVIAPPPPTEPT